MKQEKASFEKERQGLREQRQAEAATKIQAVLRGKVAKKSVALMKLALKIRAAVRAEASRRALEAIKEAQDHDDAAKKIQAIYRGRVARRTLEAIKMEKWQVNELVQQEQAAIKIQALMR